MPDEEEVKVSRTSAFLKAIRETGSVKAASEAAGVSRDLHYRRLRSDPAYKAAFEAALDDATQMLEDEAVRRATEGVKRVKYYQGVKCGTYLEYSDQLLALLLRARRPQKYRESSSVAVAAHAGEGAVTSIEIKFVSPDDSGVPRAA